VTVFTTFFGNTAYLDQTIASVLSQTFRDFEYLIVNDGDSREKSDGIHARFNDSRIRVVNLERLGTARARQRGLEMARGELIAIIDSDDICEPDRLERQVAFLRQHGDHAVVGSAVQLIDEQSKTIGFRYYPIDDDEIRRKLPIFNCIAQPSATARRSTLLKAGGYTPEFPTVEDYDLWLRVARIGKLHNLQEALTRYRIHEGAGKSLWLKRQLRDSIRVRWKAARTYGYRLTPAAAASLALNVPLLLLPASVTLAMFKRMVAREKRPPA
jgi:GT2 family glycosyltransferase